MSTNDDYNEAMRQYDAALEKSKADMRKLLMTMSKEERFRAMRQDLSQNGIETLCEWALPEEEYEICATVEEVKANNIGEFKIRFLFEGETNNKASVAKFVDKDGQTYYHADCLLHDDFETAIVMLHKNAEGQWTSDWKGNDSSLFIPIGEAIDEREKRKN
jgi:hypothetical protein